MPVINVGSSPSKQIEFNLGMANRHGLVAGATGTGKTVTLQTLAEGFSRNGVSVFLADVKGDLSGLAKPGIMNPKVKDRLELMHISDHGFESFPAVFWDVFGQSGHPARTTISDLGPMLLSKMLGLSDVQAGVLQLIFKIADESDLLLLDLKDLDSMLKHVSENISELSQKFGLMATASIGAIQRSLVELEGQGVEKLFGEPMLGIMDFIKVDPSGKGQVNILSSEKLMNSPKVYSTFLLWMLSELFENLPEAGDLEKPKLVFFFDEAHLLFSEAPKVMIEKIEQVVRLIRSKGVGVYFVTQNPNDIPDAVLGQLSNRFQHALRAFTPKDQKAIKAVAETMRPNPDFNTFDVITNLGVGEALVSLLDVKGAPTPVEKTLIRPPTSFIGPLTAEESQRILASSNYGKKYDEIHDRESAFEKLSERKEQAELEKPVMKKGRGVSGETRESSPPKGRQRQSIGEAVVKSAARTVANEVGRQLIRGILGSLLGGSRR